MRHVRSTVTLIAMLVSAVVYAAGPEESYLASRDAYIAKLNPPGRTGDIGDDVAKEEASAREDIERQLRAIVGPVKISGFSGEGTLNISSLLNGDIGFGVLDALVFDGAKDTSLVVTTRNLLDRWVADQKQLVGLGPASAPGDVSAILKSDEFYTQAISVDAAVSNYGELPVTTPDGVVAVRAMLAAHRQDFGPIPPAEIFVAVVTGQRLLIVDAPVSVDLKMMPECEKLWNDAVAKADQLLREFAANERKDQKIADQAERAQSEGDEAVRQCFAGRIRNDAAFATLTRQAQYLVDMLAKN
jgi:hypothetical protein